MKKSYLDDFFNFTELCHQNIDANLEKVVAHRISYSPYLKRENPCVHRKLNKKAFDYHSYELLP